MSSETTGGWVRRPRVWLQIGAGLVRVVRLGRIRVGRAQQPLGVDHSRAAVLDLDLGGELLGDGRATSADQQEHRDGRHGCADDQAGTRPGDGRIALHQSDDQQDEADEGAQGGQDERRPTHNDLLPHGTSTPSGCRNG